MSSWHTGFRAMCRFTGCLLIVGAGAFMAAADEDSLPVVTAVELQPFQAQAKRVATALESVGAPLTPPQRAKLDRALRETDPKRGVQLIQEIFDPLSLVMVRINAESRVKVAPGPAPRQLVQHGWSVFLVKVINEAGVTAPLACHSPNAQPLQPTSPGAAEPKAPLNPGQIVQRWADITVYDRPPLANRLSGLEVEYRILEIYSRDSGQREAKLQFDVGQGTQDLGFRNEIDVLFNCRPAVRVSLDVIDDRRPTTACFEFRDPRGRYRQVLAESRQR